MPYVIVPKRATRLQPGDMVVLNDVDHERIAAARARNIIISDEALATPSIIADLDIRTFPPDGEPHVIARPMNPKWPARLVAKTRDIVHVFVDVDYFPPMRGHAQRIASHAPKKRGFYTDPNGYDVACSCGWTAGEVVDGSRVLARRVWTDHKAEVITFLLAVDAHGYAAAYAVETREYPSLDSPTWRLRMRKRPPQRGSTPPRNDQEHSEETK